MAAELLAAPPKLLEVAHVAHRLGVSQEFVRRLLREGKLPAVRLGRRWRIDPDVLEAFINSQRTGAYVMTVGTVPPARLELQL